MPSQTALPVGQQFDECTAPLRSLVGDRHLYVAANRGPVRYRINPNGLETTPAAGGLVTALSDVAGQIPLTWIATAMGPVEKLVASRPPSRMAAPGSPRLRFVLAAQDALDWFYLRFSNPVLWFLQHGMWDLVHRTDMAGMMGGGWMLGYKPINEAFAGIVEQEIRCSKDPIVLVHDYHLYLLPGLLRKHASGALLQHFTHIPWPAPEAWEPLLPSIRREICRGLLGADVAGFQTEASAGNFLRCCERFVPGIRVDPVHRSVWLDGRATRVRSYPISVDPQSLRRLAAAPETLRYLESLRSRRGERTIVRVDRLDPSKNVVRGFQAFGQLLERRPDMVGRVRFLAFLVPSRETIPEYRCYAQEVWREVDAVNSRFGQEGWKPIQVFHEDNRAQALAGMALADVLLVNPIADGMNLVAKEGPIVSQGDMALVLSRECGAHAQLGASALSIPPRDVGATAFALERGLEMPAAERRRRLAALRGAVEGEDLSWWMHRQLNDLVGW